MTLNPGSIARTLGTTLAALILASTCVLAAANPAHAHTRPVQTQPASAIIGGE